MYFRPNWNIVIYFFIEITDRMSYHHGKPENTEQLRRPNMRLHRSAQPRSRTLRWNVAP